jgi:hypothetical protein
MRTLMRLTVVFVLAGALASEAAAETPAQKVDRIMREATPRMTDGGPGGFRQDDLSLGELMVRYDRGERLYIGCGTQARVAMVLLWREGIRSRLVAGLAASGPILADGHTFMEVRVGRRWIAYDPDSNRQFIDARGRAMGAVRATYTRPFRWRYFASDLYSETYPDSTYEELDREVDHALGILAIQINQRFEFAYRGTPEAKARVGQYSFDWTPVGKKRWAKITRGEA